MLCNFEGQGGVPDYECHYYIAFEEIKAEVIVIMLRNKAIKNCPPGNL
jgi:hypothetical protein